MNLAQNRNDMIDGNETVGFGLSILFPTNNF